MSLFEILTLVAVFGPWIWGAVKPVIRFFDKVNRADKTRKAVIRLRKTINEHHTRISHLENRSNNS